MFVGTNRKGFGFSVDRFSTLRQLATQSLQQVGIELAAIDGVYVSMNQRVKTVEQQVVDVIDVHWEVLLECDPRMHRFDSAVKEHLVSIGMLLSSSISFNDDHSK